MVKTQGKGAVMQEDAGPRHLGSARGRVSAQGTLRQGAGGSEVNEALRQSSGCISFSFSPSFFRPALSTLATGFFSLPFEKHHKIVRREMN